MPREDLERDHPADLAIVGTKHHPHAAAPRDLDERKPAIDDIAGLHSAPAYTGPGR